MKRILLVLCAGTAMSVLGAQVPANDECAGIIDLGVAPVCTGAVYTNEGATASDIGMDNVPACFAGNTVDRDVWFEFTCPATPLDFRVSVSGTGAGAILNPQVAVYRGDCSLNGLAGLHCASATPGERSVELDLTGLTPGLNYFLRISDFSGTASPNWGTFNLCVDSIPPPLTIADGGSALCSGTVYDTGGPDGNYGANEDHVFVICPDEPTGCIDLSLEYFNLENNGPIGFSDQLILYDGPDPFSPVIANIGEALNLPAAVSGGGSVCFQVQASSGCLTMQFLSNSFVEQEGFKATWNCSPLPCQAQPQPVIDNSNVSNDQVADALASASATIEVVNINCANGAYGTFSFPPDASAVGLEKGLLLTTGDAQLAAGPNSLTDAGAGNGFPGDPDLDYLGQQTGAQVDTNACVVELDVFVATDKLEFEYVFGSEEYTEYVNTNFNDIFAFLVSGPGIAGDPNLNNAINVAVLPGTNVPIQIQSVNNFINWQYFRNNEISDALQYDGLTIDSLGQKKSLTASIPVIPCNTYRLKLAIADRGDDLLDSGVFVSEIAGGTPTLEAVFGSGVDYLIEQCTGVLDELVVRLSQPPNSDQQYVVQVSGTAGQGVDYTLNMPDTLTVPAGVAELRFPIIPVPDTLPEGTETITVSLSRDFGCGSVVFESITIDLSDSAEVQINAGADSLFICKGGLLQLEATGAVDYTWSPADSVSNPFVSNPVLSPSGDILLTVLGSIGTCVDTASVWVRVIDPVLEVSTSGDNNICLGDSVQLLANTNSGGTGISWTPAFDLSNPAAPDPVATPGTTTTYWATLELPGCVLTDAITVNVDTLTVPPVIGDTSICQGSPVKLAGNIPLSTTRYDWKPSMSLNDPGIPAPVARPDSTTVFTLISTSANAYCTSTDTVVVTVIESNLAIQHPDTIDICLGTPLALQAASGPSGGVVEWMPAALVEPDTGNAVTVRPDQSTSFVARYSINGCEVKDSVFVKVDSLPNLELFRIPDRAVYCEGDTIVLFSGTYDPASYPGLMSNWAPFPGQQTPLDLWNMVITATETNTFRRLVSNGACVDSSGIEVLVERLPVIVIDAEPEAICVGDTVQLTADVAPPQSLEWDPDPSLSCTSCGNPLAVPQSTKVYQVTTPEALCPATASVSVAVFEPPVLDVPQDTLICSAEPVLLNRSNEPGVAYIWSSVPSGFTSTEPNPVVQPQEQTIYLVIAQGMQCENTDTVLVNVTIGSVDAGPDQQICPETTVLLSAQTLGGPGLLTWQPGNLTGETVEINPDTTVDYIAVYSYGSNCMAEDTVRVEVFPPFQIEDIQAIPDTSVICEGRPLRLSVNVHPEPAGLFWTENGEVLQGLTDSSIVVTPLGGKEEPLVYTYELTVTDTNGCTAITAPYSAEVIRCLLVPNVFTPNNDGLNDDFGLVTGDGSVEIQRFDVYNRWGQKVFSGGPSNPRWDGTVDGNPATSDVYIYTIVVQFIDGRTETIHGDVTLLR